MSVENIDFNMVFEETPPIAMTFSENVTTPIVNWGNIIGSISNQTDLTALFTPYRTASNQDLIDALLTKKTELANLERRVEALYKVNEGQTFDFDTDTATCYAATVPSGSVADSVTNIGGKSVVFNQLLEHGNFDVSTGWGALNGTLSVSNNTARLTCTDPSASSNTMQLRRAFAPTVNHVYYCRINAVPNFTISTLNWVFNDGTSRLTKTMTQTGNTFEAIGKLENAPTGTNYLRFMVTGMASTSDYVDFTNAMLIDLTQMFGAGNEATALGVAVFTGTNEATAIANFRKMFPNDYYAYSAGSVVNSGVKQVEFRDDDSILTETVSIPQSIQSLDGYGWSAGTVYNDVDYANKKFVKRVGRVDLGTLTWNYQSSNVRFFTQSLSDIKSLNQWNGLNYISSKYYKGVVSNSSSADYTIGIFQNIVYVHDSNYTDAAAFKTAMSGVYLYYELGTPIETDISSMLDDGFLEAVSVEGGGTVSFVSDTTGAYKLPVLNTNEFIVKNSGV